MSEDIDAQLDPDWILNYLGFKPDDVVKDEESSNDNKYVRRHYYAGIVENFDRERNVLEIEHTVVKITGEKEHTLGILIAVMDSNGKAIPFTQHTSIMNPRTNNYLRNGLPMLEGAIARVRAEAREF